MATADATITVNIDLPSIRRRLAEKQVQVMDQWGRETVQRIRQRWVGWVYGGQYRSSTRRKPTGTSRAAWRPELVDLGDGRVTVAITNRARDPFTGQAYVSHVTRRGAKRPEVQVMEVEVINPRRARLKALLKAAALEAVAEARRGPPRRLSSSNRKTLSLSG